MFIEGTFPKRLQLQSSDMWELPHKTCRCSAAGIMWSERVAINMTPRWG